MAWTLALYVATRGGMRRIPLLTGACLALLAIYLLGQGLAAFTPEHPDWVAWLRRSWWAAAVVPAVWLLTALSLAVDEGPPAWTALARRVIPAAAVVLCSIAASFAVLGTVTDLVNNWGGAVQLASDVPGAPPVRRFTPQGPFFTAYEVYLLAGAALSALTLGWLWRTSVPATPLRARFGWLVASSVLFLLAGAQLTTAGWWISASGLPGQMMLVAGIAILGWNVARYGALLAGEVVGFDFWVFAASMVGLVALYGAIFVALGSVEYSWLRRSVPVLLVITATHVLADQRSPLLDRLIFGPVSGALRSQLRALAGRVVRQPDVPSALAEVRETVDTLLRATQAPAPVEGPLHTNQPVGPNGATRLTLAEVSAQAASHVGPETRAAHSPRVEPGTFRVLVEGALRHTGDLPALAEHDLLEYLPAAPEGAGTVLERAGQLRGELEQAIARLAPAGDRPKPGAQGASAGWLHFLVLHEAYVEGRPNKQVMQRYQLSEGTFHRARRRAIDAVSADLLERWCVPTARQPATA